MAKVQRPPIVDVLDEHCEELGFLRVQRRALPFSPDAKIRHLARVEARIGAHKEALGVEARASSARALRRMGHVERTSRDPFQWAAAVEVVLERGAGSEASLWARLVELAPDLVDGFSEALRRVDGEALERALEERGAFAEAPRVLAAVADALAFRRGFAPDEELPGIELAEVRRARARGLGAGAEADPGALRRALDSLLDDDDATVRRAALWSLMLCDRLRAAEVARGRIDDPFAVRALGLAGEPADVERVAGALTPPLTRRAALCALGDLGNPDAGTLLRDLAARAEPWSGLAARALAKIAGPVDGGEDDCLATTMRAQVAKLNGLPRDTRILRGRPLDRVGAESSLEALWTAAVTFDGAKEHPVLSVLRREVPSGIFAGEDLEDASPGDGPWSS